MSKSNDILHIAAPEDHRPLAADELDQIAGGTPSIPIPPPGATSRVDACCVGFLYERRDAYLVRRMMIMSKTNDASNLSHDTPNDHRPLANSELDAVNGGIWFLGYRAPAAPSLIEAIKGESNDGPHKDPIEIS